MTGHQGEMRAGCGPHPLGPHPTDLVFHQEFPTTLLARRAAGEQVAP